jgi:hypothetical protein
MNAPLKAWGRVQEVFFGGEVNTVVTIDETNSAIRWKLNYGHVVADTSRVLGDLVAVAAPSGGERFYAVDRNGTIHGWSTEMLAPLADVPGSACSGAPAK